MEPAAPQVALRVAVAGDAPFLRDVYAAVRWPELAQVPWPDADKRAFCDLQFALQDRHYREHYPEAEFLVVERGGERIGRLYRARSGDELKLLDIALLREARGRGIGEALIRAEQAGARAAGLRMTLYVEQENPARRLYLRLGFVDGEDAGVYREMTWDPRAQPTRL